MQCYETVASFLYFVVYDSDAAVNNANDDNDDGNHDDGGHGDDDDDTTLVKHSKASAAPATSTESQIADLQQYVFLIDC